MNINSTEAAETEENENLNHETENISCYICNFCTRSQKDFSDHILCSHNIICNVCDFCTTTELLLMKHKEKHGHFKCDECNFQTTHQLLLKYHIEKQHKDMQQPVITVNNLLERSTSRKRKTPEDYSSLSKEKDKRIRINSSIREVSPEMFESDQNHCPGISESDPDHSETGSSEMESFENSENENESFVIETNLVGDFRNDLDNNDGNIAYIINKYQSNKKPTSNRKVFNWGISQTQRGKTTYYPCSGYFKCEKCETEAKTGTICDSCNIPLEHRRCNAKKYVYFCENTCVREVYKGCCVEEPNQRKLVILYVGKHSCVTINALEKNQTVSKYKPVKTKEDILENLETCLENESEKHAFESVARVPSDIDGNKYFVLESTENCDLKEIIRDGRKWQTFTQTTSQTFSNILGENMSKRVRKYKCSNQYFCFYEECPFKKRFELVNQVNWKLEDGIRRCVSCSEEMEMVKCTAEKYVAKSKDKFVLIKHNGVHKCLAKTTLETQILEEMENFFEMNPTATRSEAIVHHLVNKINFGSKQDVIDLVSISLNIWEINNCKQKGIKRLNPHGSKMEAIRHLKTKLEEIGNPYNIIMEVFDDIYICDTCNYISESSDTQECVKVCATCSMTPMEHIGPAVFISSKESLATLRELTANKSLATEACCLDHQPSRLRGASKSKKR